MYFYGLIYLPGVMHVFPAVLLEDNGDRILSHLGLLVEVMRKKETFHMLFPHTQTISKA